MKFIQKKKKKAKITSVASQPKVNKMQEKTELKIENRKNRKMPYIVQKHILSKFCPHYVCDTSAVNARTAIH